MSDAVGSGRGGQVRLALDVIATLAVVAAATALLWMIFIRPNPVQQTGRSTPPVPSEPVSLEGAPTMGAATAPVVMLEFSDFECPFCARFAQDIWPTVKAKYVDTGQVQVAFRHLPLPNHLRAQPAAVSAVCAGEQQKFWPVHDQLFAAQGKFEDRDLDRYAAGAGVEPRQFAACLAERGASQVKQDMDAAKALKVTGTPSFLIGRRSESGALKVSEILVGARPIAEFERAFASLLKG